MAENKRDTDDEPIGSDLEKVDAYVNTPADYEEIPEITDEQFARATMRRNGEPVRDRSGTTRPSMRLRS